MATPNPIAGNQFYTSVVDLAAQLPSLNVGGDLTVGGSITPGTFTDRITTLVAPTAGPAGPANVTVLTAAQSGTTILLPPAATNDWHIVLPPYAVGLRFKFVLTGGAVANDIDIFPGTFVVGANAAASGLPTAATQGTMCVYVNDVAANGVTKVVSAIGGGLNTVTGGIMFQSGQAVGADTLELECILATQGATSAAAANANWVGVAYTASATGLVVST